MTPKRFAALEAVDIRAFMAMRRADEIAGRSLMRALAGLRSFGRFLEREGRGRVGEAQRGQAASGLGRPWGIAGAMSSRASLSSDWSRNSSNSRQAAALLRSMFPALTSGEPAAGSDGARVAASVGAAIALVAVRRHRRRILSVTQEPDRRRACA